MGHRWVVDQGVCDHFERLIEVMERKEGWKEGRLEGRKGNGSQGFCGRKLIAREVPAVHVKGPRLGAFPIIENEASTIMVTLLETSSHLLI